MGCNHDEDDTQTGNEFIANIFDESVGFYSAWIGSYRAAGAGRRHSPTSGSNG